MVLSKAWLTPRLIGWLHWRNLVGHREREGAEAKSFYGMSTTAARRHAAPPSQRNSDVCLLA